MLALQMLSPGCAGFVLPSASSSLLVAPAVRRAPVAEAGLFDMFKETEAQKAAKEAEWRAQQEMMERRRNPDKMAAYNAEVNARRAAAARAPKPRSCATCYRARNEDGRAAQARCASGGQGVISVPRPQRA